MHISEALKLKQDKPRSKRADFTQQIYDIYTSQQQRDFRKRLNWKRYCAWCRENKKPDCKENQEAFRKSRQFIKEHNIKTFCFFLRVIPTNDLDYILSVAKDMQHRQQDFSGYLFANLTGKVK